MKILILCTGNSCRSQMAHGFLEHCDSRLEVRSAGTRPAAHVNGMAASVMREVGIDISAHVPQSVEDYALESWDYVITVCGGARDSCPMFTGTVLHRLHFGFDDPSEAVGTAEEIDREFHRVRDAIRERFENFYREELLPQLDNEQ